MANPQGVVHPQMLQRLVGLAFPSSCTIQQATETQDSYGGIVPSWSNLADHVNLPCRLSPGRSLNAERPTPDQTYLVSDFIITLAGNYPSITEKMQAVIGSQTYNITSVDQDGQSAQTRLTAKIVT